MQNFYTQEELAQLLRCDSRHIGRLRRAGLINFIKVGRNYIYRESDVNSFVDNYSNCDLSNKNKIKVYTQIKKAQSFEGHSA
nr:MAG TPA: helix-turn-helix domain protein [Caudoviricetes sp.]DAX52909.1 MAG TPA: helix-turn-helix domain protein [Caudoviricetes sp.]